MRSLSLDYRQATGSKLRATLVDVGRHEIRAWSPSRRDHLRDVRFGAESELAYRVLAARPQDSAPTPEQRRFLSLLVDGEQTGDDLARSVDFRDPDFAAAARDAQARGWLQMTLGGLGGLFARPPTWFELTALGSQALSDE